MKFQITRLFFAAAFLLLGLQLSAQGSDRSNLRTGAPIQGSLTSVSTESVVVSLDDQYQLQVGDQISLNREINVPNQIENGFVTVGSFEILSLNGSKMTLKKLETKDLKMAYGGKVDAMQSGMKVTMNLLTP